MCMSMWFLSFLRIKSKCKDSANLSSISPQPCGTIMGGPQADFILKPAEVPDGVWWAQVGSRRRYQLEPNAPPQEPSGLACFNSSNDSDIVEYPRYLRKPMVDCGNGHKVYLRRIPWQAGCRECTVRGWNSWMQFFLVCACFSIGQWAVN